MTLWRKTANTALAGAMLLAPGCSKKPPSGDPIHNAVVEDFTASPPRASLQDFLDARTDVVVEALTARDKEKFANREYSFLDRAKHPALDEAFAYYEEIHGLPKATLFVKNPGLNAEEEKKKEQQEQRAIYIGAVRNMTTRRDEKWVHKLAFLLGRHTLKRIDNGELSTSALRSVIGHEEAHFQVPLDAARTVLDYNAPVEDYVSAARYNATQESLADVGGACLAGSPEGLVKFFEDTARQVGKNSYERQQVSIESRLFSLTVDAHGSFKDRVDNLKRNADEIARRCAGRAIGAVR